jgi:hypothetical protein
MNEDQCECGRPLDSSGQCIGCGESPVVCEQCDTCDECFNYEQLNHDGVCVNCVERKGHTMS